jgi:hypothetical protein
VLAEVRCQEDDRLEQAQIVGPLASFDRFWGTLATTEQTRLVRQLVARVDYNGAGGKVCITFQPNGFRTLATQLASRTNQENRP